MSVPVNVPCLCLSMHVYVCITVSASVSVLSVCRFYHCRENDGGLSDQIFSVHSSCQADTSFKIFKEVRVACGAFHDRSTEGLHYHNFDWDIILSIGLSCPEVHGAIERPEKSTVFDI